LGIDVDATVVVCHSEKEQAAATFKRTFSYHPVRREAVGAQNWIKLCDLGVFVEEAAEASRLTWMGPLERGFGKGRSDAAWSRARCGRCSLKCRWYSARTATA
jgi:hypothetical protein